MRDRFSSLGDAGASPGAKKRRLRADLESRGLSREIAQGMATRLAPLLKAASTRVYGAALDAAAAAVEVVRDDASEARSDADRDNASEARSEADRAGDVAEIQRLMLGFTDELRKLEEGLRILSAFVVRMRTRAGFDGDGVLH